MENPLQNHLCNNLLDLPQNPRLLRRGGFEAASFNQTPPFENIDLFATDLALREALSRAGVNQETAGLSAFGTDFGSAETIRWADLPMKIRPACGSSTQPVLATTLWSSIPPIMP